MAAPARIVTYAVFCACIAVGPAAPVVLGQTAPPAQPTGPSKYTRNVTTAPSAAAAPAAAMPATAVATEPAADVKPEEAEQLVAAVALYPDSLLAQVLMASTYPLEVVQADRWLKENPSLKDSPDALNKLSWDPSVKSLLDFPQVLTMMSEKLDWTVKLGDAFLADQKEMMDAVQRLRAKAQSAGNLKSNEQVNVTVQTPVTVASGGSAAAAPPAQVIVVESASPQTVYVPTYNPTVVYGGWPYPTYPPYSYYPPGYVAGTALVSFGVGVAVGAAWGHAWGGCNWGHSEVDVDINRNTNFNSNIDRDKFRAEQDARQSDRDSRQSDRTGNRDTRQGNREGNRDARQGNRSGGASSFQHDPSHRKGVAYRDSAQTEKFRGSGASQASAQSRDAYRGRAEAGQRDLQTGAGRAQANRAAGGAGGSGLSSGRGTGSSGYSRGTGGSSAAGRGSGDLSGTRSSGFSNSGSAGSTRSASSRGVSSRSSSGYSSSRSSASRSGGGGASRGGGGRGGGGRR